MRLFTRHVKITFLVSLRDLYVLSFSMRKDILYESIKKFVKRILKLSSRHLNGFVNLSVHAVS